MAPVYVSAEKSETKYVQGEIIVKLKEPITELSQSPADETNWKATPYQFRAINKTRLPEKLLEIDKKHTIKSIEKVFPHKESPERELLKMKRKHAVQIKNGIRVLDENAILSNDMSKIYLVKVSPEAPIEEVVETLAADPNVEYVEPNYIMQTTVIPNDPFYPLSGAAVNQWHLENPGGRTGFVADADIDASAAWDINTGRTSTVVAVIDSGIDYKHPDLGGGIGPTYKVIGGYDTRNQDADPMDDFGHGTHIAGIIAANFNNKTGVAGVCPGCKLMALKSAGTTGTSNSITNSQAIDYAVSNGADIINASWGSESVLTTVQIAIQNAIANDVLFVAAAGNRKSTTKFYPAAFPEAFAVANTSYDDKKSTNSNYNSTTDKWIDISAPGTYILATALQGGAVCTSPHESGTARYGYCTGTSMSAPVVAGVAGLMISKESFLRVVDLTHRLKLTADNIDAKNPSYVGLLGAGRVNAQKALSSNTLSPTGCINGRCVGQCVTTALPAGFAISSAGGPIKTTYSDYTYVVQAGTRTLWWTAVSGATGYHVRIDNVSNGWNGGTTNGVLSCDTTALTGDGCRDVSTPQTSYSFKGLNVYRVSFIGVNGWCKNVYVKAVCSSSGC